MNRDIKELKAALEEAALSVLRTREFVRSLFVIPSGNGYVVEITHSSAKQLMDALSRTAVMYGYAFEVVVSRLQLATDRVIVGVMISVKDEKGNAVINVERLGEALLDKNSVPDGNAVRAAETRAFKRAVSLLCNVVEDRLIAYSEWVTKRAAQLHMLPPYERAKRVQDELRGILEKRLNGTTTDDGD